MYLIMLIVANIVLVKSLVTTEYYEVQRIVSMLLVLFIWLLIIEWRRRKI